MTISTCCDTPLVSVIVPVYKVEKYLDQCVQSLVNQTYRNLEIILIDDGSPDRSSAMCDAWVEKDARIRVIHQKNGGVSAARNAGLDAMTGELLVFVDSDDWLEPQAIELMYQKLCEIDADMVQCNRQHVTDTGRRIDGAVQFSEKDYLTETEIRDAACGCGEKWFGKNFLAYVTGILFRRQVFGDTLRFQPGYTHEDAIIFIPCYFRLKRCATIESKGYNYRINPSSIMHAGFKMSSFRSFILEPQEWEKTVREADATQYLPYVAERYCSRSAFGYRMAQEKTSSSPRKSARSCGGNMSRSRVRISGTL